MIFHFLQSGEQGKFIFIFAALILGCRKGKQENLKFFVLSFEINGWNCVIWWLWRYLIENSGMDLEDNSDWNNFKNKSVQQNSQNLNILIQCFCLIKEPILFLSEFHSFISFCLEIFPVFIVVDKKNFENFGFWRVKCY